MSQCINCDHHFEKDDYETGACGTCGHPFNPVSEDVDDLPFWMEDDEDFDGEYDYYDDMEEAMDNCSMLGDGTCMAAGSEYCDWECPYME